MKSSSLSFLAVSSLCCGLFVACGDPETYLISYGEDADEDGWPEALDCDDDDPTVFPAADEVPGDGVDQDCSGSDLGGMGGLGGAASCEGDDCEPLGIGGSGGTAEPATGGSDGTGGRLSTEGDRDGDGFSPPEDCDDTRFEVNPDAREIVLNQIDENCDGSDLIGQERIRWVFPEEAVIANAAHLAAGELEDAPVFLAAWSDSRTAPAQDLYGQLFDAQGRPLGGSLEIETVDNAAKYSVRVASKGDAYIVTWTTAEGVWLQRLQEDGQKVGTPLLMGGAGTSDGRPAFGDGYWAVAFRDTIATTAFIRAMTPEGARGDILELGDGEISALELGATEEGFLALYEGPWKGGRGLVAQPLTRTGSQKERASALVEGPVSSPGVWFDGQDSLAAFHIPGSFGYANVLPLEGGRTVAEDSMPQRISSESRWQSNYQLANDDGGFYVLWNDQKHGGAQPPAQAIYGNYWSEHGLLSSTSLPVLAGERAELGGLVAVNRRAFISVLTEAGAGLMELDF